MVFYKVINTFQEKEHENTVYEKDGTYPKEGFEANEERVKYLQSDKNPYKKAFLGDEVEAKDEKTDTKASKKKK